MYNIEKLPGKKHYTGYGGSGVGVSGLWHIVKDSSSGLWRAVSKDTKPHAIYAKTLKGISEKLKGLDTVKKNPAKKRTTKKRASKRNPIAAAAKPRPVTRQTRFTQRKADTDHVIVSILKADAADYAKKHNIQLPAKVYFDGFDWTTDARKAARYHDIAQARKVALAVANSQKLHGAMIAKSRSVGIETDTPPPKR